MMEEPERLTSRDGLCVTEFQPAEKARGAVCVACGVYKSLVVVGHQPVAILSCIVQLSFK